MEKIQNQPPARDRGLDPERSGYLGIHLGLAAFAAFIICGLFLLDRYFISAAPLQQFLPSSVPRVTLDITVKGPLREAVDPHDTVLGSLQPVALAPTSSFSESRSAAVPTITPTPNPYAWYRRPTPTPVEPRARTARFDLIRYPVSISMYASNGQQLLEWFGQARAPISQVKSDLIQGTLKDVLDTLKIRAEDLRIEGMQGYFVEALLRDALTAEAALHYDISRGKSGFVLTFKRQAAPLVSRLLPLVFASMAKREYIVARARFSIVEIMLGVQPLFIGEVPFGEGTYILVSPSLPAILNLLEQEVLSEPRPAAASGAVPLIARVRSEAFINSLLPLLTGHRRWPVEVLFEQRGDALVPSQIKAGAANIFSFTAQKLSPGVVAAIPQDSLLALATSIQVPLDLEPAQWNNIALSGLDAGAPAGEEAGLAIIWDVSEHYSDDLSAFGVAMSSADKRLTEDMLKSYLNTDVVTGSCAGGHVLLASSARALLQRMRDACERQSKSLVDLKRAGMFDIRSKSSGNEAPNLLISFSPNPGLMAIFEAGLGTAKAEREPELEPQWKADYQRAIEAARENTRSALISLPHMLFSGSAGKDGVSLTEVNVGGAKDGV